jgi:hypothetical protein
VRSVLVRSAAVFVLGLGVLGAILFYASTVDGRPPAVAAIRLTQHVTGEPATALTTTSIEVDFSEVVVADSAQGAFRIEPTTDGSFSWSGSTLTFSPAERLPLQTDFAVRIGPGVVDEAGNRMAEASDPFAFTTVGQPMVVGSSPQEGAADVQLDATIELEFSTLMDTASVEEAIEIAPAVAYDVSWSGELLTITPRVPLAEATQYVLRIGISARDQAGVTLERSHRLIFRTVRSGLEADRLMPAHDIEAVAVRTPIAVVFDRDLDPASVTDELLTIEPQVAGTLEAIPLPGAAGIEEPGARVLQFRPSGALGPNTTYQVTLAGGLSAADGTRLSGEIAWSFTTGAPLDTLSNQIVFVSDRAGIANVWAMNPDGTGQRQVSAELSAVSDFAVAPDGRSLVVADGAVLVELRADGSDRRQLTESGRFEYDPAYSPDSTMLAFGRADAETGAGLGLWTRRPLGGDQRRIELPAELRPGASPSPSASDDPAALLRAPRFSPDGAALAFVDSGGRVAVLELPAARLTSAAFGAVSAPVWLPDSTGLLVAGLPDRAAPPPAEPGPLSRLDAGAIGLAADDLGDVRVVRLDRGASQVDIPAYPAGAARVALDPDGRRAIVVAGDDLPDAGGLLSITSAAGNAALPVLRDGGPAVVDVAAGPAAGEFLVVRSADGATTDDDLPAGIWRVEAASGGGEPLVLDGRLPRWLP